MAETAQEIRDSIMCYVEDRLQAMVDLNVAQAKCFEELEFQVVTTVVRGLIELFDRNIVAHEDVFDHLRTYGVQFDPQPPWLSQVADIWCDWCEDPDAQNHSIYIDRIRAVIGMPKPEEEQVNE